MHPASVCATLQAHGGCRAEVAFEDFAVVAYGLEGSEEPSIVQCQRLADAWSCAQHTKRGGIGVRGPHGLDVGFCEFVFFGGNEGVADPADDGGPGGVVAAGGGGERILLQDIRQDEVILSFCAKGDALVGELGDVRRDGGTVVREIGGFHLSFFLEREGDKVNLLLGHPCIQAKFDVCFCETADLFAAEIRSRVYAQGGVHHERLVAKEHGRAEREIKGGVVREGRRCGCQHVDCAAAKRLQGLCFVGVGGDVEACT